jgi:hypothetical protein
MHKIICAGNDIKAILDAGFSTPSLFNFFLFPLANLSFDFGDCVLWLSVPFGDRQRFKRWVLNKFL